MTAVLLTPPYLQFFDTDGVTPLAGGLVYTYESGTTTPKETYTDQTAATPASNPVVLDSAGRATIWINGTYTFAVKNAAGDTIRTTDAVASYSPDVSGSDVAANTIKGNNTDASAPAVNIPMSENTVLVRAGGNIEAKSLAASNLLGRGASGDINAITLGSGLTMVGDVLTNTGLLQTASATYTTNAALSTFIPSDDTIPQNTEGTEIISLSFTPKSASSNLIIRFNGFGTAPSNDVIITALFVDSTANALFATGAHVFAANYLVQNNFTYKVASGSTTARTYKIRVGATASTIRMNGNTSGRLFGGTSACIMTIDEVAV